MFRLLIISIWITSTAIADTWTVDDDGSADFDNIQAAINAASDGDEIIVMPGTYNGSSNLYVIRLNGKEVWLHSSDGPEVTTLDAMGVKRVVFCIDSETSETIIEGFTLTGGSGSTGQAGGGITISGSSPEIRNCVITGNTTLHLGGGVNNFNGSPTITNCTITNNHSDSGGGGVNSINTPTTIINSVVCGNTPDQVSGNVVDGGGNTITIECLPEADWTVDDDGLDYPGADFSSIQDAVNAASNGDEILVYPGTYTDSGDQVVDMLGKAVWLHSYSGSAVTILDGENARRGIQCINDEPTGTVIEGFTITGAVGDGAGIYCLGSSFTGGESNPTIVNCTITGNNAGQWNTGGGIRCMRASPTIIGCEITNNTAYFDGAGVTLVVSNATLENCIIEGNATSSSQACGVYCSYSSPTLNNCSIAGSDGSGIWCRIDVNATLNNCTIVGNDSVWGGGITAEINSNLTLTNCEISLNAGWKAGGIYVQNSQLVISNCTITGNTSPSKAHGVSARESSVEYSGTNVSDELFMGYLNSELKFATDDSSTFNGDVTPSHVGSTLFDVENLVTNANLDVSGSLLQQGGLGITNYSASLMTAEVGDIVPLAQSGSMLGEFDSIVLPVMPEGLGLQLVEYPALRGGDTEIAVEVIEVEGAQFANPFSGDLDSSPVDMVSFDADGDGVDEIAVLFGGNPGGVAVYAVSEDGPPSLIDGYSAEVGSNPVDIDAGDLDGDGLEDLLVANSTSETITVLVTTLGTDGMLTFTDSTINTSDMPTCVAVIDWDGDADSDAVVGVTGSANGYQIYFDVSLFATIGPWFTVPSYELPDSTYVPDAPTCVDGGNQSGDWGFVGGTQYGRVHRGTSGVSLQVISELGGNNTVTIEAIELDSGGGDGLIDLIVSSDEAEVIYLFQGNASETDGFGDLIPVAVSEPVEDVLSIDADGDGDMDIVMTAPSSDTPLILLRNDGGGSGLVGGLNGNTWSRQNMNSGNPLSDIEPIDVNDDKDIKQAILGAGGAPNLRGELAATMEQTNILLDSDCVADIDGDDEVNVADLLILIGAWGPCPGCDADLDDDGEVNVADLLILIGAWGPCE